VVAETTLPKITTGAHITSGPRRFQWAPLRCIRGGFVAQSKMGETWA